MGLLSTRERHLRRMALVVDLLEGRKESSTAVPADIVEVQRSKEDSE